MIGIISIYLQLDFTNMPGTSTSTNPSGIKITFEEKSHKYWSVIDDKEVKYISGTTFVHKFVPEFDEDKISKRVAEKRGVTQKEILTEWHKKRDDACYFGTKVHEIAEDTLLNRPLRNVPTNDKEKIVFSKAKVFAEKFRNELDILGVEQIVFDHRLKIAGTIDLLARSKKDGSILIIDWKTNDSITKDDTADTKKVRSCIECYSCLSTCPV